MKNRAPISQINKDKSQSGHFLNIYFFEASPMFFR